MKRSCSILVLVAVLQVILGQSRDDFPPMGPHSANDPRPGILVHPYQERIPRHCWAPPAGINIYQCCPIPKLYPDDVMEACGVKKPDGTPQQRKPTLDVECKKGKCLMQHNNLLNEDETIDYDKLRTFIDDWAHANPEFTEAILKAKEACIVEKGPPGPPKICDPDKVFFCLTSTIIWNCKLREEIESCQVLKEHMDECKPFYMKPKDQEKTR